jgi:hypothetical protein
MEQFRGIEMSGIPFVDRRNAVRNRALMTGTLRFKTRNGALSCVVRNLSDAGARLVAEGSYWIPERFELEVPHRDMRIDARVVWRAETEMGIAFLSPRQDGARSIRAEESLRALQVEREILKRRVSQLSEDV